MPRTVLLVDDDAAVRISCAALLEDDGHTVVEAATLAEARARIAERVFDAVLTDLHLPDGLGTALVADLRTHHPRAPLVLITGTDRGDVDLAAADLVLTKGDATAIGAALERAIAAKIP